jgi:hypothetical protein
MSEPGFLGEGQCLQLRDPACAGLLPGEVECHPGFGPDPEPQGVGHGRVVDAEDVVWWSVEADADLGGGDRHRLAGPDEDGDAGPAP